MTGIIKKRKVETASGKGKEDIVLSNRQINRSIVYSGLVLRQSHEEIRLTSRLRVRKNSIEFFVELYYYLYKFWLVFVPSSCTYMTF